MLVTRASRLARRCACGACGGIVAQADEGKPFATDPAEAIDFLRRKLNVPTSSWTDLWQEQHSVAFTVAGAQSDALVADFHDAINDAIKDGTTLDDFRARFDRIVADHGWSYNGSRNWRSRVIFQTNLRTAYAAGKWDQIQRVKESRPYLRYVAVMDGRTRAEHRDWNNTVLPADDPWWQTHYPPNGWNCRCTVQSLNDRDLARYGLAVANKAPPVEMVERTINTPDGPRTVLVPEGIDPGFAYRPGAPPSEALKALIDGR
jgi:SPP1 gp7 family putative phage head morphogenesis protein